MGEVATVRLRVRNNSPERLTNVAVLDLLPGPQKGPFAKEDGEVVINAQGQRA